MTTEICFFALKSKKEKMVLDICQNGYYCEANNNNNNSIMVRFSRHDTVDPMLLPLGNPIKCREEVLSLQPIVPPKRSDIFFPRQGDPQKV